MRQANLKVVFILTFDLSRSKCDSDIEGPLYNIVVKNKVNKQTHRPINRQTHMHCAQKQYRSAVVTTSE